MLARCCAKSSEEVQPEFRSVVADYLRVEQANLTVGTIYKVFGVAVRGNLVWYLVCEEPEDDFPHLHLAALFDLVDARIPSGWALSSGSGNLDASLSLLPKRWAENPMFLELLVEGDEAELSFFRRLKANTAREASS